MTHEKSSEDPEFWRGKWQEERQPWDQNGPHPYLEDLLKEAIELAGLESGHHIFVPGCGRAHNAAFMAKSGYQVTACDFVEEALEKAKILYEGVSGLGFSHVDVLNPLKEEQYKYDAIFDRALLCALRPEFRQPFYESCLFRLRPGGLFMSITFTQLDPEVKGPPYCLTIAELQNLFKPGFSLVYGESRENKNEKSAIEQELINVWQKK